MKTPRPTAMAERLVLWLTVIVLSGMAGYETGIRQIKGCVVSQAKTYQPTQPALYRGVRAQKRWAKYEATK